MYLFIFTERVYGGLELVGVLYGAEILGPEGFVGSTGLDDTVQPFRAVEGLEDEEDLEDV